MFNVPCAGLLKPEKPYTIHILLKDFWGHGCHATSVWYATHLDLPGKQKVPQS